MTTPHARSIPRKSLATTSHVMIERARKCSDLDVCSTMTTKTAVESTATTRSKSTNSKFLVMTETGCSILPLAIGTTIAVGPPQSQAPFQTIRAGAVVIRVAIQTPTITSVTKDPPQPLHPILGRHRQGLAIMMAITHPSACRSCRSSNL